MAQVTRNGYKVSIFAVPRNGRPYYELRWKEGGVTNRKTVLGLAVVNQTAREILDNLTQDVPGALSSHEIREFLRLKQRLQPWNIHDAVAFFLKHHGETVRVSEAVLQFLEAQERRGLAEPTLLKYRGNLKAFCRASHQGNKFGACMLGHLTTPMLDEYLRTFEHTGTRTTRRQCLCAFFNWARKKGILPPDIQTVAERTDAPRLAVKDPVPLDVDTLEKILRILEKEAPELCWPVCLGAFAGLRSSEISRNPTPSEEGKIWLGSEETKTRHRRMVDMPDNLKIWKNWVEDKDAWEPVSCSYPSDWQIRASQILKAHGIDWLPNGLRKGYVSHAVAHYESIAKVALMSGHSESVLKTNYQGLKTKEDAQRWFNIYPL